MMPFDWGSAGMKFVATVPELRRMLIDMLICSSTPLDQQSLPAHEII